MTDDTRNGEIELDNDLARFRVLYEQLPNEDLSSKTQKKILRRAFQQSVVRQIASFITLRSFFNQPVTTAITSIAGVAVGILLSHTLLVPGPVTTADNELLFRSGNEMLPTSDEPQPSTPQDILIGEKMQPLGQNNQTATDQVGVSFRFFTVLPDVESVIPEEDAVDVQKASSNHYMLQVGSYGEQSKADQMKARLVLDGLEPNIQRQGQFYRVNLGPFDTIAGMEAVNQKLVEMGLKALKLKVSDP